MPLAGRQGAIAPSWFLVALEKGHSGRFLVSLTFLFSMPINEERQVCLRAHRQALRNPCKCHRRFFAQTQRDFKLVGIVGIALSSLGQIRVPPIKPLEILLDRAIARNRQKWASSSTM